MKRKKKSISLFIDVGAHHGESIKLFNKIFKIQNILAFEPSEENFNILKIRTRKFNNLKLHNIALGNYNGIVDF